MNVEYRILKEKYEETKVLNKIFVTSIKIGRYPANDGKKSRLKSFF